ncbi:hypothetical protein ACTWP6_28845 [Mycobacterium sp. 4D054]|uniref:hypothetical protein n=1 Tax=Mycobacterium sp. 4D054 TaxID=3457440 RepID=UPI003FD401B0
MSVQSLFDAVGLAPSLPGAKCRGRHSLFDDAATGEHPDVVVRRHAEAIVLCARCPALDRCVDWYESLPRSQRPFGVVAGIVNRPKAVGRPRKSA